MLVDWLVDYVKAKDSLYMNISDVSVKDNVVHIVHKNTSIGSGFKKQIVPKDQDYFCFENLDDISCLDKDSICVVLNTKNNVEKFISEFDKLKEIPGLKFIFVNLITNEVWQISPQRHHKLVEMMGSEVKSSIMSMSESIPFHS